MTGGGYPPANRWDLLDAPEPGRWTPELTVSVVVPAYRGQADLDRTMAGLRRQSYPRDLLEVVVADDGSAPPITVPDWAVGVRQEHDGFGLGRARNLGAKTASGDVLVFLDADMVPTRNFVEAHARWHHVCPGALVMGFRRHTSLDHLAPDEVGRLVEEDEITEVALERDLGAPEWLEAHFARTNEATESVADLYRMVTGGNFSIRAAEYAQLGGTSDEFREYGGEDREFAYRAQVDGLLFVAERRAFAWHQGPGGWQAADIAERKERTDALLARYIADRSIRPDGTVVSGRPTVTVIASNPDSVRRSVESWDFLDVEVVDESGAGWRFAPIRLRVEPEAELGPGSVRRIVERVRAAQLGRLQITASGQVIAVAELQRAVRRLERSPGDASDMAGFGVARAEASDFGMGRLRRRWGRGSRRS